MSIRIRRLQEEPGDEVGDEGFQGVNSVWAVLKRDDLTALSSRIFRIEPLGHTALHNHDREHVVVVVRGRCLVEEEVGTREADEGSIIKVPPNVSHRFINPDQGRLVLLLMNLFTAPKEE